MKLHEIVKKTRKSEMLLLLLIILNDFTILLFSTMNDWYKHGKITLLS